MTRRGASDITHPALWPLKLLCAPHALFQFITFGTNPAGLLSGNGCRSFVPYQTHTLVFWVKVTVVAVCTEDLPDTPHHLSVSSGTDPVSFKPVPSRWMHSAVTKHRYVRNLALYIQTEQSLAVFKCQVPARHAST